MHIYPDAYEYPVDLEPRVKELGKLFILMNILLRTRSGTQRPTKPLPLSMYNVNMNRWCPRMVETNKESSRSRKVSGRRLSGCPANESGCPANEPHGKNVNHWSAIDSSDWEDNKARDASQARERWPRRPVTDYANLYTDYVWASHESSSAPAGHSNGGTSGRSMTRPSQQNNERIRPPNVRKERENDKTQAGVPIGPEDIEKMRAYVQTIPVTSSQLRPGNVQDVPGDVQMSPPGLRTSSRRRRSNSRPSYGSKDRQRQTPLKTPPAGTTGTTETERDSPPFPVSEPRQKPSMDQDHDRKPIQTSEIASAVGDTSVYQAAAGRTGTG